MGLEDMLIYTQQARRPHIANSRGFLTGKETGMALFLAGNENADQEGVHICCMQPYIWDAAVHPAHSSLAPFPTWMLFALQNSIVCPSPSC